MEPDPGLEETLCPRLGDGAVEVLVHTDGGASPNPGPGGWAAVLWSKGLELEIAGADPATTNNRMELTAAIEALAALRDACRVTVVTDSEYLYKGMTGWITHWSKKRFRRKGGPMPNADLWERLVRLALRHETYWSWTRGHAGHEINERCDRLAAEMIARAQEGEKAGILHKRRRRERREHAPPERAPTAPIWLAAE